MQNPQLVVMNEEKEASIHKKLSLKQQNNWLAKYIELLQEEK